MFNGYAPQMPYTQMQPQFYPQPVPDQLAQLRQTQQMPQTPQQPMQQSAATGICWVQSEREAWEYLLAPNSAVALWDSQNPTIYFKQSDAAGKPSMKIYDLVERVPSKTAANAPQSDPNILSRITAIEKKLEAMTAKKGGKEVKDDA